MSEEIRKAVAYFRANAATNVDADRESLKLQQAALDAYAEAAGYDIVGTFYDAAVSGADPVDERSGFIGMLKWLLGNGVTTILVESLDRLARDPMVRLAGYEVLKAKGIRLIAASDPMFFVENAPMAVLVRQLLGAVAQFENAIRAAQLAVDRSSAIPVETRTVVQVLEDKGFQITPRARVHGSLRFYVWGGPAEAKHLHVKGELTANQMAERYRSWLTTPPEAKSDV